MMLYYVSTQSETVYEDYSDYDCYVDVAKLHEDSTFTNPLLF